MPDQQETKTFQLQSIREDAPFHLWIDKVAEDSDPMHLARRIAAAKDILRNVLRAPRPKGYDPSKGLSEFTALAGALFKDPKTLMFVIGLERLRRSGAISMMVRRTRTEVEFLTIRVSDATITSRVGHDAWSRANHVGMHALALLDCAEEYAYWAAEIVSSKETGDPVPPMMLFPQVPVRQWRVLRDMLFKDRFSALWAERTREQHNAAPSLTLEVSPSDSVEVMEPQTTEAEG